MPQLLRNICRVIDTFEKYAQKDGDCTSLSKAELKQLIQEEFADVIVNPYDPKTIESVMQLLDTDCDGKVDFEEFTVLVFKVARACHMKSQECQAPSEATSAHKSPKDLIKAQLGNLNNRNREQPNNQPHHVRDKGRAPFSKGKSCPKSQPANLAIMKSKGQVRERLQDHKEDNRK
uniref:repetin-like n=1 Tax=Euleptes europaea TaxID=460621 RepID=UPI00254041A5|nr:repetin-like [Euleptes europaea]